MKFLLAIALSIYEVCTYGADLPEIVSPAPENVAIVIYRTEAALTSDLYDDSATDGLALITETRTVEIPEGISTIKFVGTAESIIPQTAKLTELPVQFLESNFDYNVITPDNILAKSIGKHVRIVRTDSTGKTTDQEAMLRSGPDGVVLDINGNIEALGCSSLNEKIIFDEIPAGLAEKPVLSVRVNATKAGRYNLRLSYLALGLDWSADYVAQIQPNNQTMSLLGWITLSNQLSTAFINAKVQVVAGNLSIESETSQLQRSAEKLSQKQCWPTGSFYTFRRQMRSDREDSIQQTPVAISSHNLEEVIVTAQKRTAALSELGDYKLYTLPEPTTLGPQQTKQVRMLEGDNIRIERIYTYTLDTEDTQRSEQPDPAKTTIRFKNNKTEGAGISLPMGVFSVFDFDNKSRAIYSGDHWNKDTPEGIPVELEIGNSLNVWIVKHVGMEERLKSWGTNYLSKKIDLQITNDKAIPVSVEIKLPADGFMGLRITDESERHISENGNLVWKIELKPGANKTLTLAIKWVDED